MKFTREELAQVQTALDYAHVKAGSPTLSEEMKRLRDKVQSYLLTDHPTLKVESDHIVADVVAVVEGVTCIVVACDGFDHFKRLPDVVSLHGIKCGKTGWNSDKGHCYYQSSALLAQVS